MNSDEMKTGTVFNIQRYSFQDGPGIRTLIFLKGCPLGCLWCANPEGQRFQPALSFIPRECIGCGKCAAVCPTGAAVNDNGKISWNKELCTECFRCVDVCAPHAREICGKQYSVRELLDIADKDRSYYRKSGGGVTLSGGEPLAQGDFCLSFLRQAHSEWFNTAIETCGYYPSENLERVLPYLDTIYMDIKHTDPAVHKRLTGRSNEQILKNVELAAMRIDPDRQRLIVRTPVIPGMNDSAENIRATVRFLKSLGTVRRYELLPYHNYGEAKYDRTKWTGPYALHDIKPLTAGELEPLREIIRQAGLETNE